MSVPVIMRSRNGKAGGAQTVGGQIAGSAGDDGPAAAAAATASRRAAPAKAIDVVRVGDLAALQVAQLGLGVELRRQQPNRVDGAASVRGVGGLGGIESVADAPVAPDAGHSGRAVHQHAVQIEENALHQQRDMVRV